MVKKIITIAVIGIISFIKAQKAFAKEIGKKSSKVVFKKLSENTQLTKYFNVNLLIENLWKFTLAVKLNDILQKKLSAASNFYAKINLLLNFENIINKQVEAVRKDMRILMVIGVLLAVLFAINAVLFSFSYKKKILIIKLEK